MFLPAIISISALTRHGAFVEVQKPTYYINCRKGSYLVYVPNEVQSVRILVKNGIVHAIMRKRTH